MHVSLQGKLLIAMPGLVESTFASSVIFLCAHSPEGAMGLIINKPMADMSFMDMAGRINLAKTPNHVAERLMQMPVFMGGPVEQQRGFVLHGRDYDKGEGLLTINEQFAMSATIDILQDMALGQGPANALLALGYAGWSPGQLENELLHNGWLHCDAENALVFESDPTSIHRLAMAQLGVDLAQLSSSAGHA